MSEADHHTFKRDEDAPDVDGHIRRPHTLNEDSRPSSPVEVADEAIEDEGPDVEGHGHRYHGHTHH